MNQVRVNPVLLPDEQLDNYDGDSSIGEDVPSSTQSIASSILQYRRENGRTYHAYKEGKYILPNDEREQQRLDLQHHLFLITFGGQLGLSPPNHPSSKVKRVLDIGTGTGIWALDYADEHPESHVLGTDLSAIQPSFVSPNVEFIIDDVEDPWHNTEPFDYIHSRMMNLSVKDWESYFKNIYDNLAPGGYVEVQEVSSGIQSDDGSLKETHTLIKWYKLLHEAAAKLGLTFIDFEQIKKHMANAGFTDIVDVRFKWPTNRWPKDDKYKELGAWNNENIGAGLEAATMAPFTRAFGWTADEVTLFIGDVRKDLNNPKIHAYWPICSMYARKPLA